MECVYTIRNGGKITYITVDGIVTEDVIKTILVKKVWAGKDYEHPCILWDFRTGILGFGIQELRELSRFAAGDKGTRGYGRIALVVEKDLHVGFAKLYEVFTNELPFEVKTFTDFELAKQWLHEI